MRLMKKAKKKEKKKAKKMKRIEESQQQQQLLPLSQNKQQTDSQPEEKKKVKSKQDMTLDISQMVDKLFTDGVSIIIQHQFLAYALFENKLSHPKEIHQSLLTLVEDLA